MPPRAAASPAPDKRASTTLGKRILDMTVLTCPDTWTSGKEPGISTAASSLGAMVNRPIAMAAAAAAKITAREPRVQYRFQLRLLPFIRLFHPHIIPALCINAYFLYPAAASRPGWYILCTCSPLKSTPYSSL